MLLYFATTSFVTYRPVLSVHYIFDSIYRLSKIIAFRYFTNIVGCIIIIVQSDQKVTVHLMITIQKVTSNVQIAPRQSPDIY
jgi:hypothetical protein